MDPNATGQLARPYVLNAWLAGQCPAHTQVALYAWQLHRAALSVWRAKNSSPFYAQHLENFTMEQTQNPGWLARLPFTSAETVAAEGGRMLCVPLHEVARIRSIPTSGSTGPAKRIYFSPDDLARTVDFFAAGMRHMVGPGERVGICMSDKREGSVASLLAEGLARFKAEGVFCGQVQNAEQAAAVAAGLGCLVGLPAEMLYLCRKAPRLRPKTVLLSADYISPVVVQALESEWGCRVYTHYGLTETGYGLAVQCPGQEGQHIRHADFLVEIVCPESGAVLPRGKEGEVVLTSLRSEAMPLVRYRTGDIASLVAEPCACGSALPRLGPVQGRANQLSQPVNLQLLDKLLLAMPGLYGYQAAWAGDILCLLVEGEKPARAILEARLGCRVRVEQGVLQMQGQGKRRIGRGGF